MSRQAILKALQEELALEPADGKGVASRDAKKMPKPSESEKKTDIDLDKKSKTVGGDQGGETGGNSAQGVDAAMEVAGGAAIQSPKASAGHMTSNGDPGTGAKESEGMEQPGQGVASKNVGTAKTKTSGQSVEMDKSGGNPVTVKESWPDDLEEGRFTEYCKREGFDGPGIACAKHAMESDDESVRGMAAFYMNTVKPHGKDLGDIKTEGKKPKEIVLPHDVMVERNGKREILKGGTRVIINEMFDDGMTPEPDAVVDVEYDIEPIEPIEPAGPVDLADPVESIPAPGAVISKELLAKVVTSVVRCLDECGYMVENKEVDSAELQNIVMKSITEASDYEFGSAGSEVEDLDAGETGGEISDYEKEEHGIDMTSPDAIADLLDDAIADLEEVREYVASEEGEEIVDGEEGEDNVDIDFEFDDEDELGECYY